MNTMSVKQQLKRRSFQDLCKRAIHFGLPVMVYALTPWALFLLFSLTLQSTSAAMDARALHEALIIGACGILLTPIVIAGLRLLARFARPRSAKIACGVIWVLAASTVWWTSAPFVLGVTGDSGVAPLYQLGNPLLTISTVAIIFCVTYLLRELKSLEYARRRDAAKTQLREAFRYSPKVQDFSTLDMATILRELDSLEQIYAKSTARGRKTLRLVKHKISVQSDPRFKTPISLPVAIEIMRHEVTLRKEAEDWPATIFIASASSFEERFVIEPYVLCSLVVFVAEYERLYSGHVFLDISFQTAPTPAIQIQTNIKEQDLWFSLDNSSVAQAAKLRLIADLNEVVPRGTSLEILYSPDRVMVFRLATREAHSNGDSWQDIEQELGPNARLLSECVLSQGYNRVYTEDNIIYKVERTGPQSPKPLVLAEEYAILKKLEGVRGVPRAIDYRCYGGFSVLSCSKLEGVPIDQYLASTGLERKNWVRCIAELSNLLDDIHKRGVVHRDLRPGNVLVNARGDISLVDYDQAVAGAYHATQVDTRGEDCGMIEARFSARKLIESLGLAEEYSLVAREFQMVWNIGGQSDANSPGQNIAYYHWLFGDLDLPGEREWFMRWGLIREPLQRLLPGAYVLDLGCNLGLLPTYCGLYGAEHVTALDIDQEILVASQILAKACGVDIEFVQCNLNSPSSVASAIHDHKFDLVVALSVLHWLEDPSHVLQILASTPAVLYEGHDSLSDTVKLLRNLGFGKIDVLGYSERLRPICFASKAVGSGSV